MRTINPDHSEIGIYGEGDRALERIVLWKGADGNWWLVARVDGADSGHEALEVAYTLDRSERTDATVAKWAERTMERAAHPELEPVP